MVNSQRPISWEFYLCHSKVPLPPKARRSDDWSGEKEWGCVSCHWNGIHNAWAARMHSLVAEELPGLTVQSCESPFTKPLHLASPLSGPLLCGQKHANLH